MSASFTASAARPAGKAVATEATLTPEPRDGLLGGGHHVGVDADRGGRGASCGRSGRGGPPWRTSARTLPGVSAPSSVVRSIIEMARSMAYAFAVVLIERVPREAARASRPTASTPGSPCRKRRSALSDAVTSARAWGAVWAWSPDEHIYARSGCTVPRCLRVGPEARCGPGPARRRWVRGVGQNRTYEHHRINRRPQPEPRRRLASVRRLGRHRRPREGARAGSEWLRRPQRRSPTSPSSRTGCTGRPRAWAGSCCSGCSAWLGVDAIVSGEGGRRGWRSPRCS